MKIRIIYTLAVALLGSVFAHAIESEGWTWQKEFESKGVNKQVITCTYVENHSELSGSPFENITYTYQLTIENPNNIVGFCSQSNYAPSGNTYRCNTSSNIQNDSTGEVYFSAENFNDSKLTFYMNKSYVGVIGNFSILVTEAGREKSKEIGCSSSVN